MATFSKSQVDKLGDRLRRGRALESDLRELDLYRRSFATAYETVARRIREELGLEPTGRPAKSTSSIVDKLQRESARLSQIQDIAGCRLVLADSDAQDRVTQSLSQMFPSAKTIDRRIETSHGYRAVHVIVSVDGHLVEIQVRTSLQHLWAEFSEKLSDILDPSIKYGGGEERVRILLQKASEFASMGDAASALLAKMERVLMAAESSASSPDALALISDRKKELDRRRREGSDLDSRMSALLINLVIALEDGEA